MPKKGYLILENGAVFEGDSFGSQKEVFGEVVFNTGMVGYPEGFTDPSYYGQILTLTFPLIGNYGVPPEVQKQEMTRFFESDKVFIKGLIVSTYIAGHTHFQAVQLLGEWLKKEGVPALTGMDTRTLTQIIREKGVMKGMITFEKPRRKAGLFFKDINEDNLVAEVSCKVPQIYGDGKFRMLFYDCGVKLNQIRLLVSEGTTVIKVPWNYDPFKESSHDFDAVMISNGPGDPKMAKETIRVVREILNRKIPILGVCLGNQILALAAGANTYKLKYGHRGQNQPVRDELTGLCYVTTQNHGFAVDTKTVPRGFKPWFTNLNDNTNEGIIHEKLPVFSTQFHPEDMPGPQDTRFIFKTFIEKATKWQKNH